MRPCHGEGWLGEHIGAAANSKRNEGREKRASLIFSFFKKNYVHIKSPLHITIFITTSFFTRGGISAAAAASVAFIVRC